MDIIVNRLPYKWHSFDIFRTHSLRWTWTYSEYTVGIPVSESVAVELTQVLLVINSARDSVMVSYYIEHSFRYTDRYYIRTVRDSLFFSIFLSACIFD